MSRSPEPIKHYFFGVTFEEDIQGILLFFAQSSSGALLPAAARLGQAAKTATEQCGLDGTYVLTFRGAWEMLFTVGLRIECDVGVGQNLMGDSQNGGLPFGWSQGTPCEADHF